MTPIFIDLKKRYIKDIIQMRMRGVNHVERENFHVINYGNLKWLLDRYGKSNNVIANDICAFIYGDDCGGSGMSAIEMVSRYDISDKSKLPEFYGYYSDYDWVVFCSLFGTMMDLPKGFPMYCKDLKQMLDEVAEKKDWYYGRDIYSNTRKDGDLSLQDNDRCATLTEKIEKIKRHDDYPKQEDEHNALADAKWNRKLFLFLKYTK